MSQTSQEPQRASTGTGNQESFDKLRAPLPPPEHVPSTTFQGWGYFGAVMMAMMGLFWAVLGLISLFDDTKLTVREGDLLAFHSYTAWGWAHLLGGLLSLAAGIGILWSGRRMARIAGIVVAGVSAVVNLGFLSAAPVWATLVIAFDVLVIYALTVHGQELDKS